MLAGIFPVYLAGADVCVGRHAYAWYGNWDFEGRRSFQMRLGDDFCLVMTLSGSMKDTGITLTIPLILGASFSKFAHVQSQGK